MPAALQGHESHEQAVAQPRRGAAVARALRGQHHKGRVLALGEADQQVAIGVAFDDVDHAHFGQGPGFGEAATATLAQRALGFQVVQHVAQGAAVLALQPEGLGDLGLVGLAALADVFEKGVPVRQALRGLQRKTVGFRLSVLRHVQVL